ncbi:MAG TPA: low temperature requirement protein A [Chitinophagaceae bacterium]|nr:low temperature requirement protein A [Chitinophagaceae bacterium]
MPIKRNTSAWWGAPKKFDTNFEERRISWLELFYDLVYVIAIARITHHLAMHISWAAFLEYAGLFIIIFWGWLNGSLYHDIHGSEGLRTRLMTLWQVMIIAALSVTIEDASDERFEYITIVLMVMQFYITYLWWSVGFYDRSHRKYNLPYTILYLLSLGLMALSLFISPAWLKYIVPLIIVFNYMPPFLSSILLRRSALDLSLSSSMSERLGLFTIIVFGEVVLGVVNGISKADIRLFSTWLNFALVLSMIFSLWWLFFTLISNRVAKKGFVRASLLELLFIPTMVSLGLIASCLTYFFDPQQHIFSLGDVFGYALANFLICISLMMGLLEYPDTALPIIRPVRISLLCTALVFIAWSVSNIDLGTTYNLLVLLIILILQMIYLNYLYYSLLGQPKK